MLGLYQSCGSRGRVIDVYLYLACGGVGGVGGVGGM